MALTREEIKFQSKVRAKDNEQSWVSPNFGDGGSHNSPGTNRYTTEWEPLHDRILVELFEEPNHSILARPDVAGLLEPASRRGIVLKVGPGKWIPGERHFVDGEWQYFPGHRQEMTLKPGDEVVIGRWSDWESAESGWGQNVVIAMEADVRVIIRRQRRAA